MMNQAIDALNPMTNGEYTSENSHVADCQLSLQYAENETFDPRNGIDTV